jgi:sulfatase modifying factor 1
MLTIWQGIAPQRLSSNARRRVIFHSIANFLRRRGIAALAILVMVLAIDAGQAQKQTERIEPSGIDFISKLAQPDQRREFEVLPGVKMAFRWSPAGTFVMGSPENEVGRRYNETRHEVTLTKGFWLAETETTQAVWEAVMGANPSRFKESGANAPVDSVSWDDVQAFLKKVNAVLPAGDAPYRLPTEAEWEYACRAGTAGPYNVEGANLGELAWHSGNARTTHAVGQKKPNSWGLYDMHGNVGEWCHDRFQKDLGSQAVSDPKGSGPGTKRVFRGDGSCRSASRNYHSPSYRSFYLGFRVALSSTE